MGQLTKQELLRWRQKELWGTPFLEAFMATGHTKMVNQTLTDEEYHAQKWAAGSSQLEIFRETPAHFMWQMQQPQSKDTPAMRMGHMIHTAVLQPDVFRAKYISDLHLPEAIRVMNKNTKIYKEAKAELLDKYPDRILISIDEEEMMERIIHNAWSHPKIAKLLSGGLQECSAFAQDEKTGVWVKSRYDYVRPDIGAFVDLKSSRNLNAAAYSRQVLDMGTHIQVAHYRNIARKVWGSDFKNVYHIGIENFGANLVRLFAFPTEYLELGEIERETCQYAYAQCLENNEWPGYPSEVEMLPPVPKWYGKTWED